MNKQEIYKYLKARNIWYKVTEHEAVYNMKEASKIDMPYGDADAKNLFLRDDKKKNYYLLTVKAKKEIDLKFFAKKYNVRRLSFASEEKLMEILGLIPGEVTPFGILNDRNCIVKVFLDKEFVNGIIGIHPNDNTATVWLKTNDLVNILKEHGNIINIVEI